ncbi:MAG: DUF488 domain-containing protein [Armatimonadetes bacterium]|nr:DUF488 domain-containing protein [Armatimonadota bacterium]
MTLYTIGFTETTAESFFARLAAAGVTKVIDVRLNNVSQLAGFAKRQDLPYFLRALAGIGYEHRPEFAPTQEILDAFKKQRGDWSAYEGAFTALLRDRGAESVVEPSDLDGACLLCSEREPVHCHRRLVAEHLAALMPGLSVVHL